MDFEREMQKAFKVIFRNIQALDENRNEFQGALQDPGVLTIKRWRPKQRSASLPNAMQCHFSLIARKKTIATSRRKMSLY